jgi:UTP--glucose-1-phosphate uridylyltransferase
VTSSSARAHTAVVPAAGLGTRFLPETKVVAKELLPLLDRPAIQIIVEEATAAGIDDVVMVTNGQRLGVIDHFADTTVENTLRARGDEKALGRLACLDGLARVRGAVQSEPLGLGHAVLSASEAVGDESFAVMLADDLVDVALLPQLLDVQAAHGGSVVALMEVPGEEISKYGCAAVEPTDAQDVVRITSLVEKPSVEDAPSRLAVIGRYVFEAGIFERLAQTKPGALGEIQLTDAMAACARGEGGTNGMLGVIYRGRRDDIGTPDGWLRANVEYGLRSPDFGEDFAHWLAERTS